MKSKAKLSLIVLGLAAALIIYIIKVIFNLFITLKTPLSIITIFSFLLFIIYHIYCYNYFKSEKFITLKNSIIKHTKNSNDLNHYIENLKSSYVNINSYDYGQSRMTDNSNYNFNRKEWKNELSNNRTHNCSASVCKNANNQPVKYFCKYFNIDINENSLSNFEKVLNNFASVEEGKILLKNERTKILNSISKSIPSIIIQLSKNRLLKKLGFQKIDFTDMYIPVFTFQYVSPGGNSSSKSIFKLDLSNLNKLINYLNDKIKWRNSMAGQRALMTTKLRNFIKQRDNYTCRNCGLGIKNEQNLLLEIDHILPISKGGKTIENNLQTLCWKCNRTKGAKTNW